MRIIYILIIILIIIIVYLNNKKNKNENNEYFDATKQFSQEGLFNLLSSYNSIQIDNSQPINNILGSLNLNGQIDVSNNITAQNIRTNDISSNNIITNTIKLTSFDSNNYKLCLKDMNHCINPSLINLYSKINVINSPFNNIYLSDISNCEIFEPNSFRDGLHNHIPRRILSQFGSNGKLTSSYTPPTINDIGGNIDLNDLPLLAYNTLINTNHYITGPTATQIPYLFPKPAWYYLTRTTSLQYDCDISVGFKITIPSTLQFTCAVIWIQVPTYKSRYNRSFRISYNQNFDNAAYDFVFSTHKVGTLYYMPDGSEYNSVDTESDYYTQWVPIPINYNQMSSTDRSLYIGRHKTEINDTTNNSLFMITGIAFSTNPWNHCKVPAFCIHYDLNRNQNASDSSSILNNPATTYSTDLISDYVTFNGKLFFTKIPVINNGKDKMLYINTVNDIINLNLAGVYVLTNDLTTSISQTVIFESTNTYDDLVRNRQIQKLDNFVTSYDNPFARFFNSHRGNRYISTIIPANMIQSNFIYIMLQSQIASGTSLQIREIGTHDIIPSL